MNSENFKKSSLADFITIFYSTKFIFKRYNFNIHIVSAHFKFIWSYYIPWWNQFRYFLKFCQFNYKKVKPWPTVVIYETPWIKTIAVIKNSEETKCKTPLMSSNLSARFMIIHGCSCSFSYVTTLRNRSRLALGMNPNWEAR